MQFNPKPEKKEKKQLFAVGEYDFTVKEAEERVSGNGNKMIELTLVVSNEAGETTTVKDYLLAKQPRKLREAAYACGIGAKFETGKIVDADFVDRRGRLRLKIEKDANGEYPPKNVVRQYVIGTIAKLLPANIDDILAKYNKRA